MSKKTYQSIFLHGFRGVGKSTVGKAVAKKLNWRYIEMDEQIVTTAGKSVAELTKQGTDWQTFRQWEQHVLQDCLQQTQVVVSTGGGACVNAIIKDGTDQTFGELNAALVKNAPGVLGVLLTASIDVILQRIKAQEMEKAETTRPILNEAKAKKVQALLAQYAHAPQKQKEILVNEIVEDNRSMYIARQPLYATLSEHVVDTGRLTVEDAVNKVLSFI